ncbi:MAG: Mth938-like domain-containing protein [Geminicoccaceae bacterium]
MEGQRPALPPGLQLVQAYRTGGFTIAGARHAGSVLVLPDRVLPWAVTDTDQLDEAALAPLRAVEPMPDILVVGCGAKFVILSPALRQAVRAWGPVVEAMATPAACRTYNVLLAEGRPVAAALIAIKE